MADATVENKQIDFPSDSDYYMLQATEEIENENEEKNKEYLETVVQYYAKEIKNLNDIENKETKIRLLKQQLLRKV